MRLHLVVHILGHLLLALAASMLVPLTMAFAWGETPETVNGWILSLLATAAAGLLLRTMTELTGDLGRKEGFAIVSLGWIVIALFAALPFRLSGAMLSYTDAYFETMSGLTTTGASILTAIEELPRSMLFWRSLMHWFGGMGIIVLSIAILPFLGVGGTQLFRAEVPGVSKDRLTPRITSTAKLLWGVYLLLTVLEIVALRLCGMPWFESVCHTFGTVATGGFSTRTGSIGAYNSAAIEAVIIVFMFLAGVNFTLHFRLLTARGHRRNAYRDSEFLFYLGLTVGAMVLIAGTLALTNTYQGTDAFRHSAFATVSIMTTTGYATQDFNQWPSLCRFVLVLLMFVGGCAGSTGGGMKVVRFSLLLRHGLTEIRRIIYPDAVLAVKLGGQIVPSTVVANVLAFFFLHVSLFAFGTIIMTAMGLDLVTAFSSVLACISNIGPGLELVGPSANYAFMPVAGKWLLTGFMLLGRLEIYTVLVLMLPSLWKR